MPIGNYLAHKEIAMNVRKIVAIGITSILLLTAMMAVFVIPVSAAAPVLSLPSVSPITGGSGTQYYFNVTYTDSDDDAPTAITVDIARTGWSTNQTMTKTGGTYVGGATYSYNTNTLAVGDYNFTFYCNDGNGGTDTITPSFGDFSYSQTHNYTFSQDTYIQGVATNYPYYYVTADGCIYRYSINTGVYDSGWAGNGALSTTYFKHISDCFYKDNKIYIADIYPAVAASDTYPRVAVINASTGNYDSVLINDANPPYRTEGITYHSWNGTDYWWVASAWYSIGGHAWDQYNETCMRQYDTGSNFVAHYLVPNGTTHADRTSDHNGMDIAVVDGLTYMFMTIHDDADDAKGSALQIYRFNGTALTIVQDEQDWNWANQGCMLNGTDNIDSFWFAERGNPGGTPNYVHEMDFDKAADVCIGPIITYDSQPVSDEDITIQSINGQSNDTILGGGNRTLKWSVVSGATGYHLRIGNSTSGDDVTALFIDWDNITVGNSTWPNNLDGGGCWSSDGGTNITFKLPYLYNITHTGWHYYQVRAYS